MDDLTEAFRYTDPPPAASTKLSTRWTQVDEREITPLDVTPPTTPTEIPSPAMLSPSYNRTQTVEEYFKANVHMSPAATKTQARQEIHHGPRVPAAAETSYRYATVGGYNHPCRFSHRQSYPKISGQLDGPSEQASTPEVSENAETARTAEDTEVAERALIDFEPESQPQGSQDSDARNDSPPTATSDLDCE